MMITNEPLTGTTAAQSAKRRWTRLFGVAAVLAALGAGTVGGAHAGSLITGRQIKDNSLLSRDLHNGTLTGRDVRDGKLSARDFKGDTTGPTGNPGPTGPTGPAGMHDVTIRESSAIQVDAQQQVRIQVDCPQGFAVSGGLTSPSLSDILESSPDNGNRSWSTWVYNPNASGTVTVTATAVCAQFNLGP
jgi:hypothetical protein